MIRKYAHFLFVLNIHMIVYCKIHHNATISLFKKVENWTSSISNNPQNSVITLI